MKRTLGSTLVIVLVLTGFTAQASPARIPSVSIGAKLHGSAAYPRALGHAGEAAAQGNELFVRVKRIHALSGRRLSIWALGRRLGRTTVVTEQGIATFYRDHAPIIKLGKRISVRTRGVVVAMGRFNSCSPPCT